MTKILVMLAFLRGSRSVPLSALTPAAVDDTNQQPEAAASSASNPVVEWNKTLLMIVRTPGAQPRTIHPTRSFAIMHAAIYDAVNSIDRTHKSYLVRLSAPPRHASEDAAADAAAQDVLGALYPSLQAALDSEFQRLLAQIADGEDKAEGISIGQTVAARTLALRSRDGSDAQPILFVFGNAPGDYQSTPPNFPKQPQFTHWPQVTPFALERANQFRPGPPPALSSAAYSDAFNEVKSLGIANGTASSPDQALTGRFWNGAIQNYWNEITQTAAVGHDLTTAQGARLFALLNIALADSVIAFYDAKYTYNLWRPVTAIRAGDIDGNPETAADPNWLPEVGNTAPAPSYPGPNPVLPAAPTDLLSSFFGRSRFNFRVTSEVMPGAQRSFANFPFAGEVSTLSRIFSGATFRFVIARG